MYWILNHVPRFIRSWPLLRQFYWQREDIEEAERWAEETLKKMQPLPKARQ